MSRAWGRLALALSQGAGDYRNELLANQEMERRRKEAEELRNEEIAYRDRRDRWDVMRTPGVVSRTEERELPLPSGSAPGPLGLAGTLGTTMAKAAGVQMPTQTVERDTEGLLGVPGQDDLLFDPNFEQKRIDAERSKRGAQIRGVFADPANPQNRALAAEIGVDPTWRPVTREEQLRLHRDLQPPKTTELDRIVDPKTGEIVYIPVKEGRTGFYAPTDSDGVKMWGPEWSRVWNSIKPGENGIRSSLTNDERIELTRIMLNGGPTPRRFTDASEYDGTIEEAPTLPTLTVTGPRRDTVAPDTTRSLPSPRVNSGLQTGGLPMGPNGSRSTARATLTEFQTFDDLTAAIMADTMLTDSQRRDLLSRMGR